MNAKSICAMPLTLMLAGAVCGQTKLSGELKCAKAEQVYALAVPDGPDHVYSIAKLKCTASSSLKIEGLKLVSEDITVFTDATGDKYRSHGRAVGTMSNGDKYFANSLVIGAGVPGSVQRGEVRWTYDGGTGALKGLTGKGMGKCKGAADGTVVCAEEGEYQIKK